MPASVHRTLADGTIQIRYSFYANEMTKNISVVAVNSAGDTKTLTLNIRDYAQRTMNEYTGSDREIVCAMLVAMLDYGTLAQYYVAGENGTDIDPANKYVTDAQRAILDEKLNPNP